MIVQLQEKSSDEESQKLSLKDYVEKLIETISEIKEKLEELLTLVFENVEDDQVLYLLITQIEEALRKSVEALKFYDRHKRPDNGDKNVPKGTVSSKNPRPSREEVSKNAYEHVVDEVRNLERGLENSKLNEETVEPILQTILDYTKDMFDENKRRYSKELRNNDKTGHVSSGKVTKYDVLNRIKQPTGNKPDGVKGHTGHTIGIV